MIVTSLAFQPNLAQSTFADNHLFNYPALVPGMLLPDE
jgi:hypothetical protein